ncbi:MAG: DUF134 domain-containing protein [Candidatus Omnitrophica bacterium]|nr:DUF134 domain-containing protein [Candidatus Omnitrophota bacterium]
MPRPFECRRVFRTPGADYFKPRGIPLSDLQEIGLTLDEFEAIRLADLEGLYQEDAAKKMDVSRQTFGNILAAAHKKIADAIVNGKALKIAGGINIQMSEQPESHFRGGFGQGRGRCRRGRF